MDRRGFLGIMLAACAAPAVVKAGSLMHIKPILLPGIDFSFTSEDLTLSVEKFSNKYLKPAMEQLATDVDETVYSVLLSPSIITREALKILETNLITASSLKFENQFVKIGTSLTIRRPHESN